MDSQLYVTEGLRGFYKGLLPLRGSNLAFSMVLFSTLEHSTDLIYRNIVRRRKEECSRGERFAVTCLAGYAAGAVGTLISNPADNIVSSLYTKRAETVTQQAVKYIVRIAIVGPVITLQWFFYDSIKVVVKDRDLVTSLLNVEQNLSTELIS